MNYRHGFHAGNFADVVKHLALIAALLRLARKDAPFAVIDTHAGRGLYDLAGSEAVRTGEAGAGVLRLLTPPVQGGGEALSTYLRLAQDPSRYPGSPLIASRLLRQQDRLVAFEKQPDEAAALKHALYPFARARVNEADGYRQLAALLPPPERRALILIDPPYEAEDEFAALVRAFAAAFRRFATGVYMLWFPIKAPGAADGMCGEILGCGVKKALRLDVTLRAVPEGKLASAGLLVINPPHLFDAEMRAGLETVRTRLDAAISLNWLAGEE